MTEQRDDDEDIRAIKESQADPDREVLPSDMVRRLLSGTESRVRIWREFRQLTLTELSTRADVSLSYLSEIENRRKPGAAAAMKKLARALNVDMESLLS